MRIDASIESAVGEDGAALLPNDGIVNETVLKALYVDRFAFNAAASQLLSLGEFDAATWRQYGELPQALHVWLTRSALCLLRPTERGLVTYCRIDLPPAMQDDLQEINEALTLSYLNALESLRTEVALIATRGELYVKTAHGTLCASWLYDRILSHVGGVTYEKAWGDVGIGSVVGEAIEDAYPLMNAVLELEAPHSVYRYDFEAECAILAEAGRIQVWSRDLFERSASAFAFELRGEFDLTELLPDPLSSVVGMHGSGRHLAFVGRQLDGVPFIAVSDGVFDRSGGSDWITVVPPTSLTTWSPSLSATLDAFIWVAGDLVLHVPKEAPLDWSILLSGSTEVEASAGSLTDPVIDLAVDAGHLILVSALESARYSVSVLAEDGTRTLWHRVYAGQHCALVSAHGASPASDPPVFLGVSPSPIDGYGPEGSA